VAAVRYAKGEAGRLAVEEVGLRHLAGLGTGDKSVSEREPWHFLRPQLIGLSVAARTF
jgi:hypothetical protein